MEALVAIIVIVGILVGLDWASLKYGADSRTAEQLKEKHL